MKQSDSDSRSLALRNPSSVCEFQYVAGVNVQYDELLHFSFPSTSFEKWHVACDHLRLRE